MSFNCSNENVNRNKFQKKASEATNPTLPCKFVFFIAFEAAEQYLEQQKTSTTVAIYHGAESKTLCIGSKLRPNQNHHKT